MSLRRQNAKSRRARLEAMSNYLSIFHEYLYSVISRKILGEALGSLGPDKLLLLDRAFLMLWNCGSAKRVQCSVGSLAWSSPVQNYCPNFFASIFLLHALMMIPNRLFP